VASPSIDRHYEALKMSTPPPSNINDESSSVINTTTSDGATSDSGNDVTLPPPPVVAPTPTHEDFRREEYRLSTFEEGKWPSSAKMEPRKIAKAGLYYTGQYQEAKCP